MVQVFHFTTAISYWLVLLAPGDSKQVFSQLMPQTLIVTAQKISQMSTDQHKVLALIPQYQRARSSWYSQNFPLMWNSSTRRNTVCHRGKKNVNISVLTGDIRPECNGATGYTVLWVRGIRITIMTSKVTTICRLQHLDCKSTLAFPFLSLWTEYLYHFSQLVRHNFVVIFWMENSVNVNIINRWFPSNCSPIAGKWWKWNLMRQVVEKCTPKK